MHTTPIYFNKTYNNFDVYRSDAIRWNIDFKKLDKGDFCGYLSMLDFGYVQINCIYLHSLMKQCGLTPNGYRTFAIAANKYQEFGWLNKSIDSNFLLCFPKNNTIDGYSKSGFNVYTISIQNEWLLQHIQRLGAEEAEKKLKLNEFALKIDFNKLQFFRSFIQVLFERVRKYPKSVFSQAFYRGILYKVPEILIHILNGENFCSIVNNHKKSDIILFKAMEFFQDHLFEKVSIQALCKELNISDRTLEYAFNSRMGIQPNQFSKAMKLQAVRKDLIKSKSIPQVSDVASRYGFTHMSQFAADYKKFFNELPSETLQKLK